MSPRLWLTRPADQAAATGAAFAALGFQVQLVPALEIAPLATADQQQAVRNRILDFDRYQWAIFVSQNAVRYGAAWLDEYWPQLPLHSQFLAVGQATAQALHDAGLPVVSELTITRAMNSEALLALPELQAVADQQILIFRGLGGRTYLGDTLRARGARVDYCELYQRQAPAGLNSQVAKALSAGPAWLCVHSGESLHHLHAALIAAGGGQPWRQWPLLVPGERVAELARGLGFDTLLVAENATDSAMCARLQQALAGEQE
ncbi:uroporphyrinogen-III synthase [Simiduia sp. 21SJ11W-1]|uniref:uroporphyrinogen-III synthase n=1 Tax=Simiduia sp. 21SJ11W-1 TaxID=2909669 RepID=UPI0020A1BECE|nr:uroporphyrinogen-III synthase [Simiduia sp. 21SJ11W-1]UTA47777.1 uroporphyrinogen-III synthase [Simiduia sp. 21SJ11W-1]